MNWLSDLTDAGAALSRRSFPHSERRNQGLTEQLTIKVDPNTMRRILEVAQRTQMSPGALGRMLLRQGLDRCA